MDLAKSLRRVRRNYVMATSALACFFWRINESKNTNYIFNSFDDFDKNTIIRNITIS